MLADPAVLANRQQMQKLSKEHSDLREIVDTFRQFRDLSARVAEARELQKDPEMRDLAHQEETELVAEQEALFAGDLFRMYTRFAERKRWAIEILSTSSATAGGVKEVVAGINGRG